MNKTLSQLGQQLLAIWRQLGVSQRVSIALTGLLVVAGLLGVGLWSSRASYSLLYGKLDEAEASRVIAALEESKIPYEARGSGAIFIPSDKVYQVRMQLAGRGIPRGEGVGFEIFDKPNFGISDFIQRANYVRAVQGELARTIGELDQVESARVMIVIPENRLILAQQQKPTASVFVRVRGGQLPQAAVNSIRWLVANAVEGLQVRSVSVVDNLGNVLSDNEDDSIAGLSNTQLSARKNLEQYLAGKAEDMLEQVLGRGQAVVRVAAEINWDTITRFEEKYDPEGQVSRSETTEDENTESTNPSSGAGGVPGVASNTGVETNAVAGAGSGLSRTKKKTLTSQFEINRTISNLMQSAGGLQRVSAAVFVAQRFEGTGADRKAVPRTPEELSKLKRTVQGALGIVEGDETRMDQITLEEIPFSEQPSVDLLRELEKQDMQQYWIGVAQRLTYPVLAVVALFLFWRAFKRTKAEDVTLGLPILNEEHQGNGASNGNGVPGRNGHGENGGVVTVEVLNQLIRENPASMSQAVRTWMNRSTPAK